MSIIISYSKKETVCVCVCVCVFNKYCRQKQLLILRLIAQWKDNIMERYNHNIIMHTISHVDVMLHCMMNIIHESHPPCSTDGASCRLVVMWFTSPDEKFVVVDWKYEAADHSSLVLGVCWLDCTTQKR